MIIPAFLVFLFFGFCVSSLAWNLPGPFYILDKICQNRERTICNQNINFHSANSILLQAIRKRMAAVHFVDEWHNIIPNGCSTNRTVEIYENLSFTNMWMQARLVDGSGGWWILTPNGLMHSYTKYRRFTHPNARNGSKYVGWWANNKKSVSIDMTVVRTVYNYVLHTSIRFIRCQCSYSCPKQRKKNRLLLRAKAQTYLVQKKK